MLKIGGFSRLSLSERSMIVSRYPGVNFDGEVNISVSLDDAKGIVKKMNRDWKPSVKFCVEIVD